MAHSEKAAPRERGERVQLRIVVLVIACLSMAASAQAGRFGLGPRFGICMPTGDAGNMFEPGIDAGFVATYWHKPTGGFGLDLGYHRLIGSPEANGAMDRLFSINGTSVTGSQWVWRSFQATPHVKAALPLRGPVTPWVRLGAGLFGVDVDLDVPVDQLQAAGWQVSRPSGDKLEYMYGYTGGVGLDIETIAFMKIGLDTSFQLVPAQRGTTADFKALTIGVYVLFDQR
jgi:hypothetical protein